MRLSLGLVVACLAAGATLASGEEPAAPEAPPQRHTVTRGALPEDLPGRWLALAWMKLPTGVRTIPVLWTITSADGQLALTSRAVLLPATSADRLKAANDAGQAWKPAADDLDALAAHWDDLRDAAAPVPGSIDTEIIAREAFDDPIKEDPDTKDALWIVRQNETFPKKVSSIVQQVRVYAVRERRDGGYAGGFVHAAIAMAPFALPITFHGDFQLYRVSDAPRSLLSRMMDVLRGCRGR